MTTTIFFDGLCEPRNPGGWATWGYVVKDAAGALLDRDCGCIGHGRGMTNNLAEYTALLRALERVRDLEIASDLEVRGDSQLVINQATGEWSCNALNLRPLLARVHELTRGLRVAWHWVPREQNSEADALSRRAYHDARSGPAHQSRQARPGHAL